MASSAHLVTFDEFVETNLSVLHASIVAEYHRRHTTTPCLARAPSSEGSDYTDPKPPMMKPMPLQMEQPGAGGSPLVGEIPFDNPTSVMMAGNCMTLEKRSSASKKFHSSGSAGLFATDCTAESEICLPTSLAAAIRGGAVEETGCSNFTAWGEVKKEPIKRASIGCFGEDSRRSIAKKTSLEFSVDESPRARAKKTSIECPADDSPRRSKKSFTQSFLDCAVNDSLQQSEDVTVSEIGDCIAPRQYRRRKSLPAFHAAVEGFAVGDTGRGKVKSLDEPNAEELEIANEPEITNAMSQRGRRSVKGMSGENTLETYADWVDDEQRVGQKKFQATRTNLEEVLKGNSGLPTTIAEGIDSASSPLVPVMSPTGYMNVAWNIIGLLLIGYDCVMIPFEVFNTPGSSVLFAMDWIVRIFWTLNIPHGFLTGVVKDDGTVDMRPRHVARAYARTWLSLDVMLSSFDWVELISSYRALRTVRLIRIFRVAQIRRLLADFIDLAEELVLAGTVARLMLIYLWVAHLITCLWYGIAIWNGERENTWMRTNSNEDLGPENYGVWYTISFHWSLCVLSGDPGTVEPRNVVERVFAMSMLYVAFMVSCILAGSITTSMTRLQLIRSEHSTQFALLRRFLVDHGISRQLTVRVQRNAQIATRERQRNVPESNIKFLSFISQPVLLEVHWEIYGYIVFKHPFFKYYAGVNLAGLKRVCHLAFNQSSAQTGDVLFTEHEVPENPRMYFVVNGELSYVSVVNGGHSIVERGHWMCEHVLWCRWTHVGKACATMQLQMAELNASKFREILSPFPSIHAGRYAKEFVAWTQSNVLSDVWPRSDDIADITLRSMPLSEEQEVDDENGPAKLGSFRGGKLLDLPGGRIANLKGRLRALVSAGGDSNNRRRPSDGSIVPSS